MRRYHQDEPAGADRTPVNGIAHLDTEHAAKVHVTEKRFADGCDILTGEPSAEVRKVLERTLRTNQK